MQQEEKLRKGPWLEEEDKQLTAIVALLGERRWDSLAKASGLRRSGKSCRLRWLNYLRPNLKHGRISEEEEQIIIQLHQRWGNKWSRIARRLPGRTDNEIKNYWRSHLRKKELVQEQGNFGSVINDVKQDHLVPIKDKDDDILGISVDSSNEVELSNFVSVSSPYEMQLSDWMSGWSQEHSDQMIHQEDYCSFDSYPTWTSEDSNASTVWEYSSGSLWDMDKL